MGKSKNTWRGWHGTPPFQVGDRVRPNGNYNYRGWGSYEDREVVSVDYDAEIDRWTIRIPNDLSPLGYSNYTPHNFKLVHREEEQKVALERTKFMGIRLRSDGVPDASLGFTPWQDTRHQATMFASKMINNADERWLIVQTVALIESEEPRPPIKITDYAR